MLYNERHGDLEKSVKAHVTGTWVLLLAWPPSLHEQIPEKPNYKPVRRGLDKRLEDDVMGMLGSPTLWGEPPLWTTYTWIFCFSEMGILGHQKETNECFLGFFLSYQCSAMPPPAITHTAAGYLPQRGSQQWYEQREAQNCWQHFFKT